MYDRALFDILCSYCHAAFDEKESVIAHLKQHHSSDLRYDTFTKPEEDKAKFFSTLKCTGEEIIRIYVLKDNSISIVQYNHYDKVENLWVKSNCVYVDRDDVRYLAIFSEAINIALKSGEPSTSAQKRCAHLKTVMKDKPGSTFPVILSHGEIETVLFENEVSNNPAMGLAEKSCVWAGIQPEYEKYHYYVELGMGMFFPSLTRFFLDCTTGNAGCEIVEYRLHATKDFRKAESIYLDQHFLTEFMDHLPDITCLPSVCHEPVGDED